MPWQDPKRATKEKKNQIVVFGSADEALPWSVSKESFLATCEIAGVEDRPNTRGRLLIGWPLDVCWPFPGQRNKMV